MRNLLSTGIALIIVALLAVTLPRQQFTPQGLILPKVKPRQTILTSQVKFYDSAPLDYQTIGTIHLIRHYSAKNTDAAERQIINKARDMAASIGANGILVKFFSHTAPGVVNSSQAIYSFSAKAIYVNKSGAL